MHQTYTITKVRTENYRTKTFIFDKPLPDAEPGQYVMAWLPDVGEKPFSIASREPLALMVVAVGPFSEAMHQLTVGDRVWVRGPLGNGYELQGQQLLLVGGGYGVAPLHFLAQEAITAGCTIDVCIGARTTEDVLLAEVFAGERPTTDDGRPADTSSGQRSAVSGHVAVHVTTEDGSMGTQGLVTQATVAAITARRPDCVYACGPVPMLVALTKQCRDYNLPHQLSWEAHIRCGMGMCGDCELDAKTRQAVEIPAGWLVCKDGPVYRGS